MSPLLALPVNIIERYGALRRWSEFDAEKTIIAIYVGAIHIRWRRNIVAPRRIVL